MSASSSNSPLPSIAVLCGGLATRLRPATSQLPKSMLPVSGEPFIAHQLRLLVRAGFQQFILLCGYLGEQIEEFVQDGSRFGCSVKYSYDGSTLLGTAGAVRRALPLLGDSFFLVYGDSYCPTDYRRIYSAYQSSGRQALMTVFHNSNQWDRSNAILHDGLVTRYDKSSGDPTLHYIDYGVSVFQASTLAAIPPNEVCDLSSIQSRLADERKLAGLEVFERFYEIGSPQGLAETEQMLQMHSAESEKGHSS